MKNLHTGVTRGILLLGAMAMMSWGGTATSLADNHHDAWSHDHDGYWDNHGARHAYIMHEHHHGFWRTHDDGSRVFINID